MIRFTCLVCAALSLTVFACSSEDADGDGSSSSSSSGATSSSSGSVTSSSSGGESSSSGGGDGACTAARAEALQEQSAVSAGAVSVVAGAAGGGTLLYVDASAGGSGPSASQPRVYLNLGSLARVDVSDVAANASTDWDLALKRTNVHSNGGDGGPGQGGAVVVKKAFAEVTAADAAGVTAEAFFDDDCKLLMRVYEGGIEDPFTFRSALSGWYDYDTTGSGHAVTVVDQTYVVRGGKGALYKVRFESFTGTADGTEGETNGRFLIRVAPLE